MLRKLNAFKGFKTSDGTIFEDETKAINHQTSLDIKEDLMTLILEDDNLNDRHGWVTIGTDDILEFMIKYRERLIKILEGNGL